MKNIFFLIALLISTISFGQTDSIQKEKALVVVEKMPEFKGGDNARNKFIQKNIKYPQEAYKAKIGGTSYINFIVEKDGSLSEIRVLKGVKDCPACDAEAIRVIGLMPKWIPGEQGGRVVRTMFNIPIKFVP